MTQFLTRLNPKGNDPNIVKNAEILPLKATAILAWKGATFSDESECTREILDKLVSSVDLNNFCPPLLVDHDWSASAIKGRMTEVYIDSEERLIAGFDVIDEEAAEKILSGEWRDLSVTFSVPDYELLETSIVAVPAIKGARIIRPEGEIMKVEKPEETAGERDGFKADEVKVPFPEKSEDDSEEVRDAVAEVKPNACGDDKKAEPNAETEPEKDDSVMEEACGKDEDEKDKESENACGDKEIKNTQMLKSNVVENAALLSQIADLKQQVANAKNEVVRMKQETLISNTVKQWVENGMTMPACVDEETDFLKDLLSSESGDKLFNAYTNLKLSAAKTSNLVGKRLSYPNEQVMNAEDKRKSDWDSYINERLAKQKSEGR